MAFRVDVFRFKSLSQSAPPWLAVFDGETNAVNIHSVLRIPKKLLESQIGISESGRSVTPFQSLGGDDFDEVAAALASASFIYLAGEVFEELVHQFLSGSAQRTISRSPDKPGHTCRSID